ncbi:restriction endonuclease subunit S [Phaeodactylibacter xiamenensis]|mgnify:CR=1 FL=1|uniref:restriction endonuclease subunit S n=1 Tax=Phaeodactylibacter xiamenensis TaxID=1524460 RepID=UPI0024A7F10A|nr:restriction endonuclease subunit S [Phaeodactylibacter xiamenensis]
MELAAETETQRVPKGYKQTEVGMIPEDWEVVEIGELCFPSSKRINPLTSDKNFKCIELEHLEQETGRLLGYTFLKKLKSHKTFFEKGDVLFGKLRPYLRKFHFALFDGVCTTEVWVLKKKENLFNKWLYYIIQSDRFIDSANQSTGTRMPRAEWNVVEKTLIPLPPTLAEQRAIATVLSGTDALIQALEKKIAKKKLIKKGVMQELLRPKEGWEEVTFESLCKTFTKQTGFDYTTHIKPTLCSSYRKGTIPFIQNKDFEGFWFNFETDFYIPEKVADKFPMILLDERCLLISISGKIGNVGVFNNTRKSFIGGAIAIGKFKDQNLLNWVMIYLQSEDGQSKLFNNVKAGSHQNLILDDIRKLVIPIPLEEDQTHIAQILSDMDKEIEALEQKLEKYQLAKQGMMQQLLTGKIRLV